MLDDTDHGHAPGYTLGVDIGGTFTDVVLAGQGLESVWTVKTPTTPEDPSLGFIAGVREVLGGAGVAGSDLARIFHGTTTATNAILQGTQSRVGVITTQGFKHVLEIGRHDVPRRKAIWSWVKPPRPVPPSLILEVPERVELNGNVLVALDEEACRQAVRHLANQGVEAIAVCFLYSFLNPAHERRVAEIIAEERPDLFVSLSSEVLPQFREFERTVATVLNALVMPHISRYVARLEAGLETQGIRAPLLIMKSNGGVVSASTTARQAVQTVLSGPVAGVTGALHVARSAGHDSFISIDVGGTSADICLVRGGVPEVTTEREIGGLPLQIPMLDITTVGAGGGSIARITPAGSLTVGPESAGARPGPACYGLGGTDPTVTDAHLVMGVLPDDLLGGRMPLNRELAEQAIRQAVATPLSLDLLEAAAGIVAIANNNMAGAIRAVSIGRGYDPRELVLVAFGGAGPLHATALASSLGIGTVIVPPTPGVLSTYGLLCTDLQNDYVRTMVMLGPDFDVPLLEQAFRSLEDEAGEWLDEEGIADSQRALSRSADLRYVHQGWEVTVPLSSGALTDDGMSELLTAFHEAHQRLYTYNLPNTPVELVNLRVTARGEIPRQEMVARLLEPVTAVPVSHGKVFFGPEVGLLDASFFHREALGPGASLAGPAVVLQTDTTTLLAPGASGVVDGYGNLVIRLTG